MKRLLILFIAGIFLSGCTQNQNPLSRIEDVVSESDSVTQLERDLKNNQNPDEAIEETYNDIPGQSLNQNQKSPTQTQNPPTQTQANTQVNLSNEEIQNMSEQVIIKTSRGDITLKLFPDVAPKTVTNFLTKAKSDYYKGLIFHRVEDWVIQGGDPLGNGTGGGKIDTELSQTPFIEGSLGVARGGDIRVSNDSQFFICTKDCSWLTGQYTNFGEVTNGMDIVKNIQIGDTIEAIITSDETTK